MRETISTKPCFVPTRPHLPPFPSPQHHAVFCAPLLQCRYNNVPPWVFSREFWCVCVLAKPLFLPHLEVQYIACLSLRESCCSVAKSCLFNRHVSRKWVGGVGRDCCWEMCGYGLACTDWVIDKRPEFMESIVY